MDVLLQLTLSMLMVSVVVKCGQIHQAPRIVQLHVRSEVKMRFASTLVTSKVANPGGEAREATFEVTLPKEAFITSFLMEIDGVIYPGNVKEKETALKQYEKAKQTGHSAGHISRRPRETNQFQVSVNVAAENMVTFNLTYQELLKRTFGYYENVIFIDPGQIVDDMRVFVVVKESRPIVKFRVPPVSNDIPNSLDTSVGEENVTIGYIDRNTAYALFVPDAAEQRKRSEQGISGKFVVQYEIERNSDSGDVLVVDGYFVHFFAPEGIEPMPKDIVFLLDVSGSMQGKKIRQVKEAMERILDDMGASDRFNIQLFSSSVKSFRYTLQNATADNIMEAKKYIQRAIADGGTNIDYGISVSLKVLHQAFGNNSSRAQLIVFLTDGDATTGVTSAPEILSNLKERNILSVPIFCLAFGKDANFDLCKSISLTNYAVARRIYEDADASLQISGFYDEVSISLMKNISFSYLGDAARDGNITTTNFKNYFAGSELVVAGQLETTNVTSIDIAITGIGSTGAIDFLETTNSIDLNILPSSSTDITIEDDVTIDHINSGPESEDIARISDLDPAVARSITEKMWAYLTIKQLLTKMSTTDDKSVVETLQNRILDLSLKYQFVTPLTSMVVTKPNQVRQLSDLRESEYSRPQPARPIQTISSRRYAGRGGGGGRRGGRGGGGGGGGGRGYSGGGDPHFVVPIPEVELPLCFDVESEARTYIRLLEDPVNALVVNAAMIPTGILRNDMKLKTYMGEIFIRAEGTIIVVTPRQIITNSSFTEWTDGTPVTKDDFFLQASDDGNILTIRTGYDVILAIRRRISSPDEPIDYLNIHIQSDKGLSGSATGILGHLVKKKIWLKKIVEKNGRTIGSFRVKDKGTVSHFHARLHMKHDLISDESYMCWNAIHNIDGLFKGKLKTFVLKGFYT